MSTYTYNTRVSLIKAGKKIATKITVSLTLVWCALIIASVFLLFNNNGFATLTENNKADKLQIIATEQSGKKTEQGAFVLVVRNKKMTLTRYTAYIDNNQPQTTVTTNTNAATAKTNNAVIVRQQKKNKQEKKSDFSVKRVPYQ